jgi:hypothetical protein
MVQRHRVNDRNFRVIEGGKRNWGVPPAPRRPALPPEPHVDVVAVVGFGSFIIAIAAIWIMLYFKGHS